MLRKGADFQRLSEQFHISPIIARLIRNKDIMEERDIEKYLHGTLDDLHNGMLLQDMDVAADILKEKIEGGKAIRIIGDYDIDGVNATYILLEGLGKLGARVDSDIPERIRDGYGLNMELIERAIGDGIDTIVTCDNGIAAAREIAYAKESGVTVIVTDHHQVPYEEVQEETGFVKNYFLPKADAVIDPKRADDRYPFKGLCGAAVAYKLIEVLYDIMGADACDVDYLMEHVAIATIGDVMDLVDENRIFVKQGLQMLRRTKNLGLKSLMECTNVDIDRLSAYHIGFVIGPCINASGRLDTAKRALELMQAKTKKEADILSADLKALNDSRKDMTAAGVEVAIDVIEHSNIAQDRVLVVFLPDCHESLAGIIAGRIRERYYRPVFVLTRGEDGVKGSGRSIEEYHMYEELNKCQDLLIRYGGHKLAAGLSLKEENVTKLRQALNSLTTLTEEDLEPKVSIDMQMPLGYVSEQLVDELELLEPFGKGNTKPVFVEKNIKIQRLQVIGKNRNVIKCQVMDGQGTTMEALYFGDVQKMEEYICDAFGKEQLEAANSGRANTISMAFTYYPGINEYMGKRTCQMIIQNYR